MANNLKGLGESLLIIFLTAAINIIIGLVVWAAGMYVLKYVFSVEGIVPGIIWALIIGAVAIAGNYHSWRAVTGKVTKLEEAPRSFFEIFERSEYRRLLDSLKKSPKFRISFYLAVSVLFLACAVISVIYFNRGYLLAPVFIVFMLYMWYTRWRSMRLTAMFYNGNTLIARGRAQDALYTARTMLKMRRNSVSGCWLMGNSLFALRNYDGAVQAYEDAIRYSPAAAKFLLAFVGLCFQRLGLYQRALRSYQEALRLNPGAKEVHYGLACTYALMGDAGHALGHLDWAAQLGYVDRDYVEKDRDLDNIRNEPRFQEIVLKLQ